MLIMFPVEKLFADVYVTVVPFDEMFVIFDGPPYLIVTSKEFFPDRAPDALDADPS